MFGSFYSKVENVEENALGGNDILLHQGLPVSELLHKFFDNRWSDKRLEDIWPELVSDNLILISVGNTKDEKMRIKAMEYSQEMLINLDYMPCRLPRLEPAQWSDPNKGMWELFGEEESDLLKLGVRARDPDKDVRHEWVAIDFGTSSTVVARGTQQGGKELLRVGLDDFYKPVEALHYENPTVLEFLDLASFFSVWNSEVYRPALNWDWVRAANEALKDYHNHANNPDAINSVVRHIKRWARESDRIHAHLVDLAGREMVLPPLTEKNCTANTPLTVGSDDPLDVVELYAWYLGMTINWRGGPGLYYKYAMTFPVKYEQAVIDKVLASFRRGLQRSLPHSFIKSSSYFRDFEVIQVSTEPTAYAVAMLPRVAALAEQSMGYAVFDFGGGTTDFDFGVWRLPTKKEVDNDDPESVFERHGAGGDPTLGGENLLALITYHAFQNNIKAVRDNQLLFTKPKSEPMFSGSEAVIDGSSIAQSNTALLLQNLRPLLETTQDLPNGNMTIDFRNAQGQPAAVTFTIDAEGLRNIIRERIERGVESFVSEMQAAFTEGSPEIIHILLAGNASRSTWVKAAFDTESDAWVERILKYYPGCVPQFLVHQAPPADDRQPNNPTCKTAVALGALALVPGSAILQVDRLRDNADGDAPFQYFVGELKQEQLRTVFLPGDKKGEWREMGAVRNGVFRLLWTTSPRARTGMAAGDPELRVRDCRFPAADKGFRCHGRVIGNHQLELLALPGGQLPDPAAMNITQFIDLSGAL